MSSMWVSITSWITPTSLFVCLNLVIGTIFLSSRRNDRSPPTQQHAEHPQQLYRPPSLVERVRSITSSTRLDPTHAERAPSLFYRIKSFEFPSFNRRSELQTGMATESSSSDPDPDHESGSDHHHVERTKSVPTVAAARKKMKRSASQMAVSAVEQIEKEKEEEEDAESVERRRPATTTAARLEKVTPMGDEAVDAKADDFINKFKQQLKLQRLDSLLRYRDILHGKNKA